jgi:osmoprotectant transport system ATP-binding protein
MITLNGISKSFGAQKAVDDISLQANDKEILVLLGTSGCGKTTTLKMINRLIEPDSGTILINGKNIKDEKPEALRKTIGFVMQHAGLFPHYTVAQNIAILPDLLRWGTKKIQSRTTELLEKLNLPQTVLTRYPHELSGGQQQRVGIARALIADTPVLLMDEPFGALDNITKAAIHKEFKSLDELTNKTTVLVTHDVQEAFELGHRICLMDKGQIVQTGTPQDMLYRPANKFVKDFFASNRLVLEYKIATLSAIAPHLKAPLLLNNKLSSDNVWQALQTLSADNRYTESYEDLIQAFNHYRKLQTA